MLLFHAYIGDDAHIMARNAGYGIGLPLTPMSWVRFYQGKKEEVTRAKNDLYGKS